ncbi:MAG: Nramp family divalent metal transporter [Planctomycetes bacterium]|nr:Nramp family divalent metal transporter [Planctomycetota bacterium]MBL7042249.1 Nramp family divalent metal transporter [Pirellulaceae bacterium]
MSGPSNLHETPTSRLAAPPQGVFRSLTWIGPMLLLLGTAIGSGELLVEPATAARYGGSLFWAILFIIVTKALWNEAIGRVSIVTGQSFLESCSGGGPVVSWVPWAWYAVNVLKDFFLRGGIIGIGGIICYDAFGPLPLLHQIEDFPARYHIVTWTLVNYVIVWCLLLAGGYRLAETVNTVLSLLFTACLVTCAVAVLPRATEELVSGLVPQLPTENEQWLMLMALAGIVMSGSTTVFYSAWAEERQMGLFGHVRRTGHRLTRDEIEPKSSEEEKHMFGWLRVNTLNVTICYVLGALICMSTFILGIAVLRPAGVTLKGAELAPELSMMMTQVAGPWAKNVFYVGAYAAVISTTIGILDGGSRMYVQPLGRVFPTLRKRLATATGRRIIMTLMVIGCASVYALVPDALKLVLWMGAVDAPLVGVLIAAYAYLVRCYLPQAYRRGLIWTLAMVPVGGLYFALGVFYLVLLLKAL